MTFMHFGLGKAVGSTILVQRKKKRTGDDTAMELPEPTRLSPEMVRLNMTPFATTARWFSYPFHCSAVIITITESPPRRLLAPVAPGPTTWLVVTGRAWRPQTLAPPPTQRHVSSGSRRTQSIVRLLGEQLSALLFGAIVQVARTSGEANGRSGVTTSSQ